jgi:hypothetical protein
MKKTVVIGASANPERYSFKVIMRLQQEGHPVVAIGLKPGKIGEVEIVTGLPEVMDVDTVSLYLNAKNQEAYYNYILGLQPKRILFNPGAENPAFEKTAMEKGIEVLEACNLVMLSVGNF